jgi:hypothetical protein
MKKILASVIILCMCGTLFSADLIVTKDKREYRGKILKVMNQKFAIRLTDGSLIALPQDQIAKIYRGNDLLDFEEGMRYRIQKKYPYIPFSVLGIVSGAYAVDRFQEYGRRKDRYAKEKEEAGDDVQSLHDNSGSALAAGVVSTVLAAGSFYVAFRPLEVKVPIGKIKLSAVPGEVRLSLNF